MLQNKNKTTWIPNPFTVQPALPLFPSLLPIPPPRPRIGQKFYDFKDKKYTTKKTRPTLTLMTPPHLCGAATRQRSEDGKRLMRRFITRLD